MPSPVPSVVTEELRKAVGQGGLYRCSNCGYEGGAITSVPDIALKQLRQAERKRIKFTKRQQRKRSPPRY